MSARTRFIYDYYRNVTNPGARPDFPCSDAAKKDGPDERIEMYLSVLLTGHAKISAAALSRHNFGVAILGRVGHHFLFSGRTGQGQLY